MPNETLATHVAVTPDVVARLARRAPVVTVVGEPMLDGWWLGRSTRMAREAPAPVVRIDERRDAPGGAANTALNLASLGARVRIVGLVGDDTAGRRIVELLGEAGVDTSRLIASPDVQTITKTRIVTGDQVLARLDEGQRGDYPTEARALLADAFVAAAKGTDALVVCDYTTGMLDGPARDAVIARVARPSVVVVDGHDPALWADLRPDLATPNAEETAALLGVKWADGTNRVTAVADAAEQLLERTGSEAVVVTLDRDGTVALGPHGVAHRTWARPASDKQASGAGDTFAAALTLARAGGLPLTTSLDLAQAAADVVVSRAGTSVCTTADLMAHLDRIADSALTHDQLFAELERDRAAGKRIVLTNGCFDVLHRGHTAYLNQAKRLGDVLVVAINGDDSVRRLKGPERPINTSSDRAGVLAALSCVDYVTVFDTDTPIPLIRRIRPDVYAKGGDYTADEMRETPVVREYGGEVRILDYLADHSTTAVVERIRTTPPAATTMGASA